MLDLFSTEEKTSIIDGGAYHGEFTEGFPFLTFLYISFIWKYYHNAKYYI